MNDTLLIILIILAVFILTFFVYIIMNVVKNISLIEEYGLLSEKFGASLILKLKIIKPLFPTLNCKYKERTLIVDDVFSGGSNASHSSNTKGHMTNMSVSLKNQSNFGIVFRSLSGFKDVKEYKEVKFNDEQLDKLIKIRTSNIEIAEFLLKDEILKEAFRAYYTKYQKQYPSIQLKENKIFSENIAGMFSKFVRLMIEARIDLIYILAEKFEEMEL